jgi:F0F1-type ATP synthase membrane subunit b/b'
LSIEIEELTRLVEEEKSAEEKLKQARIKAEEMIKRARDEASKTVTEASSSPSAQSQSQPDRDFEDEKQRIEQAHRSRIDSLNKLAQKNLARAVEIVVKEVARVGL